MLAAVEGALARVGLDPYDQVQHGPVDDVAGPHELFDMTPIHAYEVNGAIHREPGCGAEAITQEGTNVSGSISPEAMANSRCLRAPRPTTLSIFTL